MAKGRDTMLSENTREEITASDGLQLGHTSVDQSDFHSAEEEVRNLENKVAEVSSPHPFFSRLPLLCLKYYLRTGYFHGCRFPVA